MTRRWLALLLLPLALTACGYNTIQTYDEQANAAQGQIEVQLQRRADLIPSLVATVKGFANQELAVFSDVARARSGLLGAVQSKDPEQMANANQTMTGALGRLLVVSEAYPQLKSDQSFLKLQDELWKHRDDHAERDHVEQDGDEDEGERGLRARDHAEILAGSRID